MHYFSTKHSSPTVRFREAVLNGQPPDQGLYYPSEVPQFTADFFEHLATLTKAEIAVETMKPFVDCDIPDNELRQICEETVDFEFPLVQITPSIAGLELFHGPTLAFKDVGARFMSRCLAYFSKTRREKTLVIAATSGDTGGAVAAGFHGAPGVEVVILYPKGRVSRLQELQLTTFGGNVTTLEIHGNFDDCQTLAKQALADAELQRRVTLSSANSINVARWLPQQFYYLFALQKWDDAPPVISVPSGNFGNLAAGLIAHLRGMPVKRFLAACNANDVVPRYLATGNYEPRSALATLSNAMDVGAPSNFQRILEMFSGESLGRILSAVSISDEQTADTMRSVYEEHGYMLDPHGAVGYRALADHLEQNGGRGFFLETAHPAKFDSVGEILGEEPILPAAVTDLYSRPRSSIEMNNNYDDLKDLILSKI